MRDVRFLLYKWEINHFHLCLLSNLTVECLDATLTGTDPGDCCNLKKKTTNINTKTTAVSISGTIYLITLSLLIWTSACKFKIFQNVWQFHCFTKWQSTHLHLGGSLQARRNNNYHCWILYTFNKYATETEFCIIINIQQKQNHVWWKRHLFFMNNGSWTWDKLNDQWQF